ncbi:methionyl-tRNA formyltransferase [Neisseriaceae bacterium ESL0693]|nr:methionyl-tRNA formyltransferase [Neisseriaceae bacterium ESL0693]
MKPSVIFAGTPDFAAAALIAIAKAGFEIPLVLTQPDRPKGRGMKLQSSAVKQAAEAMKLTIAQPTSLKNTEAEKLIRAQQADVMVVAAYGLILPENILSIPRYGCLNIHASLLPRWRGAAPIQRAIEAGDHETGVCIMQMDPGLDTGAVLSRHSYAISATDTAMDVHNALMALGAEAIVADLQQLDQLKPVPQPDSGATYAAKLTKAEARIQWHQPAEVLVRQIRAFNPTPGAWTLWQGQPLKIWQATEVAASGKPNTIIKNNGKELWVATGSGALNIQKLQPAGSKPMPITAFLAGNTLLEHSLFSDMESN